MFNYRIFKNKSFALDLGNNNTLLTDQENILFSQPSCIVFDSENNSVRAVGEEAYNIFEKHHQHLKPVMPMRRGVIADYESASIMLKEMVKKTFTKRTRMTGFNNIISGVPYSTTDVERRALRETLEQFNSSKTNLLFEPLAAAIGMGLDIREPDGKMIVDIGGGITEIVIISLSGIAVFQSSIVAGDFFNIEIQDYFRKKHGLIIGIKTAEAIKVQAGSVVQSLINAPDSMLVRGKDMKEGIPVTIRIDYREIALVLNRSIQSIEESILQALEICPPELSADIYRNGIYLTGGGALLRGIKERFERTTMLHVHIDQQPLLAVSKGISKTLARPEKFRSILM